MDFELSAEHKLIRATARRIAREKVLPRVFEIDQTQEYPEDIFGVFRDAGLLGTALPEEYGGAGAGTLGLCLAVEETAKYCQSSALILLLTKLPTAAIQVAGTEEQKQKYLRGVANGDLRGAFGLTEPSAGSDVAGIRTVARRRNGDYVLNGTKVWISGATVADFFTIGAKTDASARTKGFSIFVVDRDTPGFRVGKHEKKMGVRGVPNCELIMEDCVVPARNLVGPENSGFHLLMRNLNIVRPVVAARGLGAAQGVLQYAVDYAKQREAFGQPISQLQALQFKMADRAMEIEASRLLTYQAAQMVDEGKIGPEHAHMLSIAKAFATETAVRTAHDALQILGAYGYSAESLTELIYRDVRQLMIVEGTSEVHRTIIARAMLNDILNYR
ncbi:MAG: acyl-CoA dehydrogenase family protein [Dehalococcoidia bacterium]|nr:acyl-CoA dehydrogenase family protein [Dehalococcoidia bacterium]